MNGTYLRKMRTQSEIGKLPDEIKKPAKEIYPILDRIEWLKGAPLVLAMLLIPLSAALFILIKVEVTPVLQLTIYILSYVVGAVILKVVIFNPLAKKKAKQLNQMIAQNHIYQQAINALKKLEPDMFRQVKNLVPLAG